MSWLHPAQVASTGDVVYALPQDFQATLRARSWWLRAQPALAQVRLRCDDLNHSTSHFVSNFLSL